MRDLASEGSQPRTGAGGLPRNARAAGPQPSPVVVIPCVAGMLRTEVVEAAHLSGFPVHILTHAPAGPDGYAAVLRRLWHEPYEWVLCEQDTVPPRGAIRDMAGCLADWCTLRHWVGTHWETRSLGVARFNLGLRRRLPDLVDLALGPKWHYGPPMAWPVCDTEIARRLEAHGIEPHVHQGETRHLHRYRVESETMAPGEGPQPSEV